MLKEFVHPHHIESSHNWRLLMFGARRDVAGTNQKWRLVHVPEEDRGERWQRANHRAGVGRTTARTGCSSTRTGSSIAVRFYRKREKKICRHRQRQQHVIDSSELTGPIKMYTFPVTLHFLDNPYGFL